MGKLIKRPKLDLSPFCDRDTTRYTLGKPWLDGEYVYATDGRIIVRTTAELCDAKEPEGRVPKNVAEVIIPVNNVRDWDFLPPIVDCNNCSGVGAFRAGCEVCKGVGYLIVDEKFTPCGECDYSNWLQRCGDCQVSFGKSNYGQWYMNLIRLLPEARIGNAECGAERPLYFRFDGGVGCLMPLAGDRPACRKQ